MAHGVKLRPRRRLERLAGGHQVLQGLDRAVAVEGVGDVEVDDRAGGGASGAQAQAGADVLQQLALDARELQEARRLLDEPGAAGVEEGRGAEGDEMEVLVAAVEALLEADQEAPVAGLVAQRVAAQSVVAAKQQLVLEVEVLGQVARGLGDEQAVAEGPHVVAHAGRDAAVLDPAAAQPAQEVGAQEEDLARSESPAVGGVAGQHEPAAVAPEDRRGPAEPGGEHPPEVEVLGALDLLEVADGDEAVLDELVADPGIGEGAVGGGGVGRREAGSRGEEVAIVGEAEAEALGEAVEQAGRQAAVDLEEVAPLAEAVDDLAAVVERVDADVVQRRDARRPAGVEGVEGALDVEGAGVAVAVVGEGEVDDAVGVAQAGVAVTDQLRGAVDVLEPRHLDVLAGAEEVLVLDVERGAVGAAGAAEVEAELQRPDVPRQHLEIDLALVLGDRPDGRLVQVAVVAQQPLALAQGLGRVGVAGLEEQLALDHLGPGGAVQAVDEAEDAAALAGPAGIEDVLGDDVDGADLLARGGRLHGLLVRSEEHTTPVTCQSRM